MPYEDDGKETGGPYQMEGQHNARKVRRTKGGNMTTETITEAQKLFNFIQRVSEASGAGKTTIIGLNDNALVRKFLDYVYNPHKTYGIRTFDAWTNLTGKPDDNLDGLWALLDKLARRELTGNKAAEACAGWACRHSNGAYLLRLILEKDLGAGISAKSINKAIPGLIPVFSVMLAKDYTEKRVKWPVLAEVKYDGKRITTYVKNDSVVKYSRNGLPQTGYEHIDKQLKLIQSRCYGEFVPDGELMFGMFGSRKEQEANADYVLYDWLTMAEWTGKAAIPTQAERRKRLEDVVKQFASDCPNIKLSDARICNDYAAAEAFYNEVVSNGGEGIMLKDLKAKYAFERSAAWLKMKPVKDLDAPVTGFFEGEYGTKYAGQLGGIVVTLPNGVNVRVGGGFSDNQRKGFWEARTALIGQTAEVRYTETTPDGSLRYPRFVRIRDDK